MTTIIQHAQTGRFYSASGQWCSDENQAMHFERSLAALQHVTKHSIRDAVLVIKFSDPKYDIRLHPFGETVVEGSLSASTV